MTHAARLTQKYLEGEILKLLEGESARLYRAGCECNFCDDYSAYGCPDCPIRIGNAGYHCRHGKFRQIANSMLGVRPSAIPGALAIHMWLYEL